MYGANLLHLHRLEMKRNGQRPEWPWRDGGTAGKGRKRKGGTEQENNRRACGTSEERHKKQKATLCVWERRLLDSNVGELGSADALTRHSKRFVLVHGHTLGIRLEVRLEEGGGVGWLQ